MEEIAICFLHCIIVYIVNVNKLTICYTTVEGASE